MGYTEAESGITYDKGYTLRHAIAHLANRDAVVSYIGTEAAIAIYTPCPPCYGKYAHPDIKPGGAREDLTHPYDPATATAILNADPYFPIGGDGWRFWDRNLNGVNDGGFENLVLKLVARVDDPNRDYMGTQMGLELEAQHIHMNVQHITITAARLQWMTNKDSHLYTAGWSLGITPDSLVLWHGGYYWHPGRPYNVGYCNKDAFNNAADGVQYANTQDDAVYNARIAQESFTDSVLGIAVYCSAGYKVMSTGYVGAEAGYTGEDWYGVVNWLGYGLDNGYTFMNMHTANQGWGGELRYGFKTVDLRQMNPIYSEWLWDNTVLGLVGWESLVAVDPYTLGYMPWVCQEYTLGTYVHPTWGTCTKIKFTLRNDVYFSDGIQLSIADIAFTFIEIDDILAERGLAPPWWISNVQNILSFSILDPLNFEVLLDVKSIFATGWIGGNRILPKHIWKPICEGAIAPKSGVAWDPTTFAPDPNMIAQGPFRFDEYVAGSHILLQANKPGSVVDTGIVEDPNANSVPVTSPNGYFKIMPLTVEPYAQGDGPVAKVNPGFPNLSITVPLVVYEHNLWTESWDFQVASPPLTPPYEGDILIYVLEGCPWVINNVIEDVPNGVIEVCDVLNMTLMFPDPPTPNYCLFHVQSIVGDILHLGQCLEVEKTVWVDGILQVGPVREILKPCHPVIEIFNVELTKCKHTLTVSKHMLSDHMLVPNNDLIHEPFYCNTYTWTWPIWITIPEDITGSYYVNTQLLAPDCKVDLKDVFLAGKAFGSVPGDFKWNAVADINHDYKIDLKDYFAIAKKFGKW